MFNTKVKRCVNDLHGLKWFLFFMLQKSISSRNKNKFMNEFTWLYSEYVLS